MHSVVPKIPSWETYAKDQGQPAQAADIEFPDEELPESPVR